MVHNQREGMSFSSARKEAKKQPENAQRLTLMCCKFNSDQITENTIIFILYMAVYAVAVRLKTNLKASEFIVIAKEFISILLCSHPV